ncbi:MAG: MoxR family ATPase [Pirellulaceae bacterium]
MTAAELRGTRGAPSGDAKTNGQSGSEPPSPLDALREALNAALRGKREVVEMVLACLLARGHLLVEDLPGFGKTTLAKALASAIGGRFSRIQCTPDLLPGDITGFSIFNQETRAFEFKAGPVFADVLLADEINRATPRTQSALLEVMAERQVTIDNTSHALPDRFFVIATQNPIELHGTFPLPEAQLDRFAIKLHIGPPSDEHLKQLLEASVGWLSDAQREASQVIDHDQLIRLQRQTADVAAAPPLVDYLVRLAEALGRHTQVVYPVSPRGLLIWLRLAQAWAVLDLRDYTTPDDVRVVAQSVLGVRLGIDAAAVEEVVSEVLAEVDVPDYKYDAG